MARFAVTPFNSLLLTFGLMGIVEAIIQALWTADLQLRGVRLERWLHQARGNGAPPYISGRMEGEAKVTGRGRSTAEILGSLDGSIRMHLSNATVSHVAVEAAGLDPAQALGVLFKGDEPLAIDWYFAFNLFRLASIVQGIAKRVLVGTAANARAQETAAQLPLLVAAAWHHAERAGA